MSQPTCSHQAERARLMGRGPRSVDEISELRALVASCPDCARWWRAVCEAEGLAVELASRAPAPASRPSPVWLLVPVAAVAALTLTLWPSAPRPDAPRPDEPRQLTLASDAAVASVVLVSAPDGSATQHLVREQDAELRLRAPADAWVSLNTRAVRLPERFSGERTLLVWAAGDGRLDLLNRERLVRGADEVATVTPLMAPQQVAVGDGLEIVVAVLEGEVSGPPPSVSARAPTAGLPEGATCHVITIEPAP